WPGRNRGLARRCREQPWIGRSGLAGNQHEGRDVVAEAERRRAVVLVAAVAAAALAVVVVGRTRGGVVAGTRGAGGILRPPFRLAFSFHGFHLLFRLARLDAGARRRTALAPAAAGAVTVAAAPFAALAAPAGPFALLALDGRRQRFDVAGKPLD